MPYQRSVFATLGDIFAADSLSWGIVAALTLFAIAAMRTTFPVKSLATVYAPALVFGGLAGIHVLRVEHVLFTRDPASNAVIAATIGLIVTTVILILLTRLVYVLAAVRAPRTTAADLESLARRRRTGIKFAPPGE